MQRLSDLPRARGPAERSHSGRVILLKSAHLHVFKERSRYLLRSSEEMSHGEEEIYSLRNWYRAAKRLLGQEICNMKSITLSP
jgi:hypothetical protein